MAIKIRMIRNNIKSSPSYGKWFGKAAAGTEVHSTDLAEKIEQMTSFTSGEVEGLLFTLAKVMRTELQAGNTVVLDRIGRFRLAIETEGVDSPREFNQRFHVKRMKCKFSPAQTFDQVRHTHMDVFASGCETTMLTPYDSPRK